MFFIILFIWLSIVLSLNYYFHIRAFQSITMMSFERLTAIEHLVNKNVEREILKSYLGKFKIPREGFLGLYDSNNKSDIITNTSHIGENMFSTLRRMVVGGDYYDKVMMRETFFSYLGKWIKNDYIYKYKVFKKSGYVAFFIYKPRTAVHLLDAPTLILDGVLVLGGTLIVLFLINLVLKFILLLPLSNIIEKTYIVSDGDLTELLDERRSDELGHLSRAYNETIATLKALIRQVYEAIIVMTKILRSLFRSSKAVTESANAQAITIKETRGNFEKLNSMVKTITEESARANKYSVQALEKARDGMESIQKLEKEMGIIESSSLEITDIIRIINDIAEQTELLSLNASIESARAGEAGRGFNVVAREVSKLAEKSTQAANRIYELITKNNKIIKSGVKYSKNATNVLRDIAMSNELSANIIKSITDEIQKVKSSSNEILGVINYISEVAQANLLESENVSHATQNLGEQAAGLQEFVGNFDVRPRHMKDNQKRIEGVLKAKLLEVDTILEEYGESLYPTGKKVSINEYDYHNKGQKHEIDEIQIGDLILTFNNDFIDAISRRVNSSVALFQRLEDSLICVSTTVQNYDTTRTIGTIIKSNSEIYKKVMVNRTYFGRLFVVNRWYVGAYKPIINKSGYLMGVIYIGLPEEQELLKDTREMEDMENEA